MDSVHGSVSKEELIESPCSDISHVVLLGAGASRAAFQNEKRQKQLPIMDDMVKVLGLTDLLKKSNINCNENFEVIYSHLEDDALKEEIEIKIKEYFSSLELPNKVTYYDYLLLSLRKKDAIFTFNWDPLLFDSYLRNRDVARMPNIFFLHGNVRIGACVQHPSEWGVKNCVCQQCNKSFSDVPLLFPVEEKNYFEDDPYTEFAWNAAKQWFQDAFTLTIFGYSAPISDKEAVQLLKSAWLNKSCRQAEHIEIIDTDTKNDLTQRWSNFIPTFHSAIHSKLEDSRLWGWPRRSCEALFYPMVKGRPCEKFPFPNTDSLLELQEFVKKIADYECQ